MKKTCILFGNCHMSNVYEGLINCKSFINDYNVYIYSVVDVNIDEFVESDCFKKCDLFIHQAIQKEGSYGLKYSSEYLCRKLPSTCKKISIPNLYWLPMALFPQAKKGGQIFSTKTLFWKMEFYEDDLIEKMLTEGKSVNEIIKKYKEVDLNNNVDFLWKKSFEKIVKREQDWDIKISSFILEKYKNEYLFYDPGHPTEEITVVYVMKILEILGYKYDLKIKESIRPLVGKQMPITNSVSETLGLPDEARLRCKDRYINFFPGKMNINTYVIQYCAIRWRKSKQKSIMLIILFLMHIIGPINMLWRKIN